ncbi:MAG TPA: acyl-CoA dehydrogenase family protein [Acidimicrobiales bacterium]|nr:acyl-CoA dehydrogenase family protein [Acidimicrobiales bacterium]
MDFEFSEEQNQLREAVSAVLEAECPPSLVRQVVEKGSDTEQLWSRFVELDWPALTVPERHGGLGLGFLEATVVAEEMGRRVVPSPYLATVSQFVPAVAEAAGPEQADRLLRPVAAAGATGTLALEEAGGSWPPGRLRTRASRRGAGFVLEGEKRYVVEGERADQVVVVAEVDEGDGVGLFVVPGRRLEARPLPSLDPTLRLATMRLEGVEVGPDEVLGTPGAVRPALERALEQATVALAVSTVGTCQAIFDMTLGYVKQRRQFGVPVGSFQAVKHKMADMYLALERARAVCYFAALTIAEDDQRRSLAASMAKAAAGECQRLVVQDGLQLHGGIGYTWEYDLHLYLKRAKAGDALLGTAAAHRAQVARLVGLAP